MKKSNLDCGKDPNSRAKKLVWIILLIMAVSLAGFIWSIDRGPLPWNQTPTCCTKPPTPPPTPTPTPPPVEPPVVPPTVITEPVVAAIAYCDHTGVWEENPNRRHLVIFSPREDIEVNLVEVRCEGKLFDPPFSLRRVTPSKMHLYGAFPEWVHEGELEVTVYYTVKAKFGIRFLNKSVVHCVVRKTN